MDASDTRRGQPSVHRQFAARHAAANWRGSADAFGAGAAILIGDLLLAWSDEMLRASGLPPAAVWRGLAELDAMRTEVFSGQFLDLAGQAARASTVDAALRVVTYKSAKYTVERPLHLGGELAAAVSGAADCDRAAARAAFTGFGDPDRDRVPAQGRCPGGLRRSGQDRQAGHRRPARRQADGDAGDREGAGRPGRGRRARPRDRRSAAQRARCAAGQGHHRRNRRARRVRADDRAERRRQRADRAPGRADHGQARSRRWRDLAVEATARAD